MRIQALNIHTHTKIRKQVKDYLSPYLPWGLRTTDDRLDVLPTIRGKARRWKAEKPTPKAHSKSKIISTQSIDLIRWGYSIKTNCNAAAKKTYT